MAPVSSSAPVPQERLEENPDHQRTLAESIMMATRCKHATVNKLITARVALALPPYSTDPSSYITGLLHIAPIYLCFEERWQIILAENSVEDLSFIVPDSQDSGQSSREKRAQCCTSAPPTINPRIYAFIEKLYMPNLMRSKRLKQDIASLTGWPNYIVEEQLATAGQSGQLGEFILHMETAFKYRPHVLVAYAYILHMALFSGGRYMRASFRALGDSFWQKPPSPVKPSQLPCRHVSNHAEPATGVADGERCGDTGKMPLRFFEFESNEDGEDLKRQFKQRLLDLESVLTDEERDAILREGVHLFENVESVIYQLDAVCASTEPLETKGLVAFRVLARMINPPGSRVRDSVVVTKERGVKSSKATNSDGDGVSTTKQTAASRLADSAGASITHKHGGHPRVSDYDGVALCPAMSKSIRFEKPSAKPVRLTTSPDEALADLSDGLKTVSKRLSGTRIPTWLLVVIFGALVAGAVMTGRGSGGL